jgi:hypothetical protein
MARDKLITIRIEGEKRQAFGELAKSQNTDTASLLYDFISQCLDGRIDIKLVTGKGNRLDKLDNRIDSDRLDKLETDTQEIDNRLDTIAKKLNDWVFSFDDRLNDCGRELSDKMISLEHRLNTLSIQLDSQEIDSEIDSIDTDRQGENPDIEPVATVETVDKVESVDDTVGTVDDNVETVTDTVESDSIDESVTGSIGPVPGDSSPIEPGKGEGMNAAQAYRYHTAKGVKVSEKTLSNWISKNKEIPTTDKGDEVSEYLVLRGKLYYPNPD